MRLEKERTETVKMAPPGYEGGHPQELDSLLIFPVGRADVYYVYTADVQLTAGQKVTLACVRRTGKRCKVTWRWHFIFVKRRTMKAQSGTLLEFFAREGYRWKSIPAVVRRDLAVTTAFVQYEEEFITGNYFYNIIDSDGRDEPDHSYKQPEGPSPSGLVDIRTTPDEIAKWSGSRELYFICEVPGAVEYEPADLLKKNAISSAAEGLTVSRVFVFGKAQALRAIRILKTAGIKGLTIYDEPKLMK